MALFTDKDNVTTGRSRLSSTPQSEMTPEQKVEEDKRRKRKGRDVIRSQKSQEKKGPLNGRSRLTS